MKKILITLCAVVAVAASSFGQGRVSFNNTFSGNAISITTTAAFAHAGEGAAGANLGSTYNVQLYWAPQAAYGTTAAFLAAAVGSSTPAGFFGTTGGSPGTDGAGLFDVGAVPSPVGTSMPAGSYTMGAFAWYNVGAATYASAVAQGFNIGNSTLFNIAATASPTPANNTVFPSFTVAAPVPEPGTLALLGLGAAGLFAVRRRK